MPARQRTRKMILKGIESLKRSIKVYGSKNLNVDMTKIEKVKKRDLEYLLKLVESDIWRHKNLEKRNGT
jgi:hypothetical protein